MSLYDAGDCTKCGSYSKVGRNSAGQCMMCHNAGYAAYRAALKSQNDEMREKGRQYWASRGIAVGAKVRSVARDMLTGGLLGSFETTGVAKVGKVGAYVSSNAQRGYLSPNGWELAS